SDLPAFLMLPWPGNADAYVMAPTCASTNGLTTALTLDQLLQRDTRIGERRRIDRQARSDQRLAGANLARVVGRRDADDAVILCQMHRSETRRRRMQPYDCPRRIGRQPGDLQIDAML